MIDRMRRRVICMALSSASRDRGTAGEQSFPQQTAKWYQIAALPFEANHDARTSISSGLRRRARDRDVVVRLMAVRLGILPPSSNTVLEPVTAAMLSGAPDATAHFARFKVTEIALTDAAL